MFQFQVVLFFISTPRFVLLVSLLIFFLRVSLEFSSSQIPRTYTHTVCFALVLYRMSPLVDTLRSNIVDVVVSSGDVQYNHYTTTVFVQETCNFLFETRVSITNGFSWVLNGLSRHWRQNQGKKTTTKEKTQCMLCSQRDTHIAHNILIWTAFSSAFLT